MEQKFTNKEANGVFQGSYIHAIRFGGTNHHEIYIDRVFLKIGMFLAYGGKLK